MNQTPPLAPRTVPLRRQALLARMAGRATVDWQTCEPRLVLSAQLLCEMIPPVAPAQSDAGLLDQSTGAWLENDTTIGPQLEQHVTAAHQLSGWNSIQQNFGLQGDGQTVAIIDSGIAWDHMALGKGYGAGYRVVGGWDFAENDALPYDDGPSGFHGTHVAGIVGSDDAKFTGVAPGVDLVALRVFNDTGQGQLTWVEQALSWVHTHRNSFANPITTVNLSLGSSWNSNNVPSWATLEEELRQLYDDGIIVTASAGNSFKQFNAPGLSYPAASPYVLPVASVDDNGLLSDFSQRGERALAAPGRNIMSTVPDHVLGRDGKVNDFSTASGTSMAAPYVAGASVLVREAMQMVGLNDISPEKIMDWLHDTADTIYDAATKTNYHRLDLQHAIDALIPEDTVANSAAQAQSLAVTQKSLSGWINQLGDSDVFRLTPTVSGQYSIDADSRWLESLQWDISSQGQSLGAGALAAKTLHLQAGHTYDLRIAAADEIGPFQFALGFQADAVPNPGGGEPAPVDNWGIVDYSQRQQAAGSSVRATAMHDGIFTVQWHNPDAPSGQLAVRDGAGIRVVDTSWSNGVLRLDLDATAGETFEIQLPGSRSDTGQLTIADVVSRADNQLRVRDTAGADKIQLDLSRNVSLDVGAVHYDFATNQVGRIALDGTINNDQLSIVGSSLADKVNLRPGLVTLENTQLSLTASGIEQVQFESGNGTPDRVYLYDSDGDDTLQCRPGSTELVGAGYRFQVDHVDRIFVHATGRGQDQAYLYDSAGNDQLIVRPQFTSLWGDGYFHSIRGFERVYVYATAGGFDSADLYDSAGDDRFSTGGEAASIVGAGFFSYTRYFEQVQAHATAGGHDVATLYGSNQQTQWQRGSDFVSLRETGWDRNAQGFEKFETYVNGLALALPQSLPAPAVPGASFVDSDSTVPASAHVSQPAVTTSPAQVEPIATTEPAATPAPDASQAIRQAVPQARAAHDIAPPLVAAAACEPHWNSLSQTLSDIVDLQKQSHQAVAAEQLKWHGEAQAERKLLDKIFTDYADLAEPHWSLLDPANSSSGQPANL